MSLPPERELLEFLRGGKTTREVADRYGVSIWTARRWLSSLYERGLVEREVHWIRYPWFRRYIWYSIWRVQKGWIYTKIDEVCPEKTPEVIAEIRIFVYTLRPDQYGEDSFDREKDEMIARANCTGLTIGVSLNRYVIEDTYIGYEEAIVTRDEVTEPYDELTANVYFWKSETNVLEYLGKKHWLNCRRLGRIYTWWLSRVM